MVETVFYDAPEMTPTINCESQFIHYLPGGGIITGPTEDIGVLQIHEPTHGRRMIELGLDITDIHDNLTFGRILYDESGGAAPWVCAHKLALI